MATRPILFAEHALLRFGGGLGADTWSCGIRLAGSPASSDTAFCEDNIDDAADAVQTWWTAFPQGVSAYFNGLANLAWVKLNAIDSAGRYQDTNNTNLVEIQPAIAPSGNASLVAPQLSICLTLRTANKRGLARGSDLRASRHWQCHRHRCHPSGALRSSGSAHQQLHWRSERTRQPLRRKRCQPTRGGAQPDHARRRWQRSRHAAASPEADR